MQKWQQDEAFKKRSAQVSLNRLTETGGPGTGSSRHTGGSISSVEHKRRMRCPHLLPQIPNFFTLTDPFSLSLSKLLSQSTHPPLPPPPIISPASASCRCCLRLLSSPFLPHLFVAAASVAVRFASTASKELLAQEKAQASASINQEVDLDELMDDPELEKLHAERIATLKLTLERS
ncbi:uncharacterized protein LOC127794301 [Diospyros lotus]|uniref:uncharacterized protein LOC127794301 n=1 Tax=Diospyros lotus TaxID=55363 RepID=UPI0022508CBD|nr:uncharacterized protein LOC127794301 [Diospyros lotus]